MNLQDFLDGIQQVKKLGSLRALMEKIPGMNKVMPHGVSAAERELNRTEAIILSMTPGERRSPGMINWQRRTRIASGSGSSIFEVAKLLRDYDKLRHIGGGHKPPPSSA